LERARGRSARAPLDIVFSDRPPFATAREHGEIVDLVKTLLGNILPGIGSPGSKAFILNTLSGGRSGAYVFKATPWGGSDRAGGDAPAVVKISPLEKGVSEKANYDQFVRPHLPVACRADLLGFAQAYGRAALCYSFVGDGERPETLTDRFAAGDGAALNFVLSTIFERLRQSWYSSHLIEVETDLARYYLDRYFEDLTAAAEAEATLFGCASRYFGARPRGEGYSIGEAVFPSVCGSLFSPEGEREYRSCVLHGDLNTDNVIVDRNRAFARLIDFQRTGRGHIYQDLVSLEASVRINYPSSVPIGDILEIERLIALGEPGTWANGYAVAISHIREAARRIFGFDEGPSAYRFSVAAIGLRLMKATDLSDAARARISASTLWAAKALKGI
jgi:hypothetical protein